MFTWDCYVMKCATVMFHSINLILKMQSNKWRRSEHKTKKQHELGCFQIESKPIKNEKWMIRLWSKVNENRNPAKEKQECKKGKAVNYRPLRANRLSNTDRRGTCKTKTKLIYKLYKSGRRERERGAGEYLRPRERKEMRMKQPIHWINM